VFTDLAPSTQMVIAEYYKMIASAKGTDFVFED
jgi:hypothetical protein